MSVFKALIDITYYPDGFHAPKTAKAGELITLADEMDYLIGSQVAPEQVEKIDPAAIAEAAKKK